jgi:TRAP-type C4-dicarboxylate transport system permease small subunit
VKDFSALVARWCAWVAAAFLAAMMLLTVADVLGRSLFATPIHGTYELIELLLTCTFYFALPAIFLRDGHVLVDVIDSRLPRAVPWLKRFALVVAAVMLGIITWRCWLFAKNSLEFGDVTSDLSLSLILYWIPLLVGFGGAAVAAVAMAVARRNGNGTTRE